MDKAAVFVDGGYLSRILKDEYGEAAIDFHVLSEKLCQGCDRLRTYYYNCMPYQSNPPNPEEKARYAAINIGSRFLVTPLTRRGTVDSPYTGDGQAREI